MTSVTRLNRLLYVGVRLAWVGVGLAWVGGGLASIGTVLAVWDGSETASAAVNSIVGGGIFLTMFTAAAGWAAWNCRNLG